MKNAKGGERREIPDPGIVLELTVRLYAPPVRKELNELHFEAIYAENQHCDTRGHTREVKGVSQGHDGDVCLTAPVAARF